MWASRRTSLLSMRVGLLELQERVVGAAQRFHHLGQGVAEVDELGLAA